MKASPRIPTAGPEGREYHSLSTDGGHTCALTRSGEVFCWGDNTESQLGNGSGTSSLVPVKIRQ